MYVHLCMRVCDVCDVYCGRLIVNVSAHYSPDSVFGCPGAQFAEDETSRAGILSSTLNACSSCCPRGLFGLLMRVVACGVYWLLKLIVGAYVLVVILSQVLPLAILLFIPCWIWACSKGGFCLICDMAQLAGEMSGQIVIGLNVALLIAIDFPWLVFQLVLFLLLRLMFSIFSCCSTLMRRLISYVAMRRAEVEEGRENPSIRKMTNEFFDAIFDYLECVSITHALLQAVGSFFDDDD